MGKSYKCSNFHFVDQGTVLFWFLMVLLLVLVIGNFVLTVTIISFFKIGMGMENIKLIPELKIVKFYGIADFNKVYKKDGLIESYQDEPTFIGADDSPLKLNLISRSGSMYNKFIMSANGTEFKGINFMQIKDPNTYQPIFSSQPRLKYKMEKETKKLDANMVSAADITSPINETLEIKSDVNIHIKGIEGTNIDGKEVFMSADQNIFLQSMNGSIYIVGHHGVYINVDRIPTIHADYGVRTDNLQYKLCACYPNGKIYRVALAKIHNFRDICKHFDKSNDPCL